MSENAFQLWMSGADLPEAPCDWPALLELVLKGDVAAFEQLMLRTQYRVLTTARRLLGDPADAEEAAQEVFLRVYKYLHRFDRSKPFEPWLYRMTVNVCNDIASRRPRPEQMSSAEDHELPSAGDDPNDLLDLDKHRRLLQTALSFLPEQQRTAVVLRDLQGLSVAETADAMKISPATVRSHLSTARVRLRDLIQKHLRRRTS
jgi:RNA polymerase sigma-70 factor (ECF subfamily)